MTGAPCVYRRPSGIYVVRLVVPQRLQSSLGRREIHASTGLREWPTAKLAALTIQLKWRRRFMALDAARLATQNPLLQGEGLIAISDAAQSIGLSANALLGELLNDRTDIWRYAQHWQGLQVPDYRTIDWDPEAGFILNDVEEQGIERQLSGLVRAFDSRAALASLISSGTAVVSTFRGAARDTFFSHEEISIPLSAWLTSKSSVEAVRSRLAVHISLAPRVTAISIGGGAPPILQGTVSLPSHPGIVIADAITAKHGNKRFSELFALAMNHRIWSVGQIDRMKTEAKFFIELMDDPELASIEVETIHEFARRLSRLPTDVYQTRRRIGTQTTLQDLTIIAEREGLELKNQTTVKNHVGRVGEILNYAVQKGMMHANPASGFKREWGVSKRKRRSQDHRDIFSPEDLQLIFSHEWYRTGAGEFFESGVTYWIPYYYWLPLLALTSGGRLNELAQLYLDDIRQSEKDESVWYLDFNLDQPAKGNNDDTTGDKSLKTVNAIRVVPLHPAILKAGLLDYVDALRKAGELRLFPELKADPVKGYGKPAGSWFNERFLGRDLGMVRDGMKTFHSLRHTFTTALERLEINERIQAQLNGHERGSTQSGTRYTKDRTAAELSSVINRLDFPCLDNVARFDIPAGLRALEQAKRRKKSKS